MGNKPQNSDCMPYEKAKGDTMRHAKEMASPKPVIWRADIPRHAQEKAPVHAIQTQSGVRQAHVRSPLRERVNSPMSVSPRNVNASVSLAKAQPFQFDGGIHGSTHGLVARRGVSSCNPLQLPQARQWASPKPQTPEMTTRPPLCQRSDILASPRLNRFGSFMQAVTAKPSTAQAFVGGVHISSASQAIATPPCMSSPRRPQLSPATHPHVAPLRGTRAPKTD